MLASSLGKPERGREKACGLRGKIGPGGIRRAHDGRQTIEGGGSKAELLDHGVERAAVNPTAPEDIVNIEGRGMETLRDRSRLRRRDEQENGMRVDEAANEPRGRQSGRPYLGNAEE